MREEYDIKALNPRKNPYAKTLKKQVTINLDDSVVEFFKKQSESIGIPYQTLINLYLRDCVLRIKRSSPGDFLEMNSPPETRRKPRLFFCLSLLVQ